MATQFQIVVKMSFEEHALDGHLYELSEHIRDWVQESLVDYDLDGMDGLTIEVLHGE